MLIEVKVPQLSESVAEATLLNWHKQQGQYVNRDENLVDIETDKVVLETPAPDSGVLTKIMKGDGGTVTSNEIIAQIDTAAAKPADGGAAAKQPAKAQSAPKAVGSAPSAMPAAQKLAAEKQVDTGSISGTGRGGRVTKGDVLQVLQGGAQPAAKAPAAPAVQQQPAQARAPTPPVDLGDLG